MLFRDTVKNLCFLEPRYLGESTAVVYVSDHDLIGKTVTTISSMLEYANKDEKWDIIILHDNCDVYDQEMVNYYAKQFGDNISIRMYTIQNEYGARFVKVSEEYPQHFVTMTFLPYIVKRFKYILYVSNGEIFRKNLKEIIYANKKDNSAIQIYGKKRLSAALIDVGLFRMKYSALDVTKAMDKECILNTRRFFENIARNAQDIVTLDMDLSVLYNEDHQLFFKYAYKTPFFEKMLHTEQKLNNSPQDRKERFSRMYLFPFEYIPQNSRIIIYGNGNLGKQYLRQLQKTNYCNVVAICDRNAQDGVVPINIVRTMSFDKIVIAIDSEKIRAEVEGDLLHQGIPKEKIVSVSDRGIQI